MREPKFEVNTVVFDNYWKVPVGILGRWKDNTSRYLHGWYYDIEIADGENLGVRYTSHEDSFEQSSKVNIQGGR